MRRNQGKAGQSVLCCPALALPTQQWHFPGPGLGGGDTRVTREGSHRPRLCSSSLPLRFEAIPVAGSVFPAIPGHSRAVCHTLGWHGGGTPGAGLVWGSLAGVQERLPPALCAGLLTPEALLM